MVRMIGPILYNPPLGHEIIQIVRFPRCPARGCDMGPSGRVPMHARGAEMLEGARGDLDDLPVVKDERLRANAAFGHHGHGGDEAELFVDAGAQVGVAEFVEGGRVRPLRGVGG